MNQFLTVLLGFVLVLQFSSRALAQEEGQPLLPLMPGRLYPNLLNDENRDRLTNSESMKQRAQYNLEVWESHRFPWLPLISLATLGLGLFFVRYVRSHRVQPVETEAERKKRLQQEALQVMHVLSVSSLLPRNVYDKLSHTVRNYLGEIYHLPAATQSTEDFLAALFAISALPKERYEILASFLLKADQIEFGDYSPSSREQSEDIVIAQSFIK